MGILTNLIELSHQQAAERRREEMGMYSQIMQFAGQPNVDPQASEKLVSFAMDGMLGLADKKSAGPLREVGQMFKGLIGKQQSQARQGFQQVLSQLGQRPGTTLNLPGGSQVPGQTIGGGGPGPVIGGQQVPAPPQIQTPGVNMSQMLPPRQEQLGPMSPKLLLSPQEQLQLKLGEVRDTERVKNEMADIFQAHKDQMAVDQQDRLDKQTLKSFQYYKSVFKAAGLSDREAEDRAGSLLGRPMPRETATGGLTGTLGEMAKAQDIVAHPNQHTPSEVKAAQEYITKETKTGAEPGNLGERERAQDIVDHPTQHTPSQVKAAKDFLAKQAQQPLAVIQMGEAKSEAEDIAKAIERHELPPDVSGLARSGVGPRVLQILAKDKFNYTQAREDWLSTQAWIRSGNSPPQLRLRQAIGSLPNALKLISNRDDPNGDMIGRLKTLIPRTRFPVFNKAALDFAKGGFAGEAAASLARQLEIQITDTQADLAQVYKGGNSPTDVGISQAQKVLSGDWSEKTLRDAVDLALTNVDIRGASIKNTGPGGTGGGIYAPLPEEPPPTTRTPLVKPPRQGAKLDKDTALKYVQANGGDRNKAFDAAIADGWDPGKNPGK